MKTPKKESIESPAIRKPSGEVVAGGPKHVDIPAEGQRGFTTSQGDFVNRREGQGIAQKTGQTTTPEATFLHSEELKKPAETVKEAAIKSSDGKVFTGVNHLEADTKAQKAGYDIHNIDKLGHDGFITSTGRYVDRLEAKQIADKQGQIGSRAMESKPGEGLMAHQIFDENDKP